MDVYEHYGFSRRSLLKLGMGGLWCGGLLSVPRGASAAELTHREEQFADELGVSRTIYAEVKAEIADLESKDVPTAGCVEIDPGTIIDPNLAALEAPAETDPELIEAYQLSYSQSVNVQEGAPASAPLVEAGQSLGFAEGPAASPTAVAASIPSVPDRAILSRSKLWDQRSRVTYRFLQTDSQLQSLMEQAFAEWAKITGLTFDRVSSGGDIRIAFMNGRGHYSCIGKDSRIPDVFKHAHPGKESLNIDPGDRGTRDQKFGICLHEIGHAIGLEHEHRHPSIEYDEQAVIAFYAQKHNWSESVTRHNILARLGNLNDFYLSSRLDPDEESIMMYWGLQRLLKRPLPGGRRLPEAPITKLSPTDRKFVADKYGHSVPDDGKSDDGDKKTADTQSRRAALKAGDAVSLKTDGAVVEGELKENGDLKLYKLTIASGAAGEHVIETVENAGVGITLELFDGDDFAVEKAIQVSKSGDGAAVLDGYLKASLKAQDYYVIVRHHHERGRGKFKLRAQAGAAIPATEKGTFRKLKQEITDLQKATEAEIRTLDTKIKDLKAKSPRTVP